MTFLKLFFKLSLIETESLLLTDSFRENSLTCNAILITEIISDYFLLLIF